MAMVGSDGSSLYAESQPKSQYYVYTAYCYRRSSVVCLSVGRPVGLSVCLSVCWSVTIVSRAKTAEPIEIPFGMLIKWGGSREPFIRWDHIVAPWRIRLNRPCVKLL